MGGYYTERELWFSALYGGAVYRKTGETEERLNPSGREISGTNSRDSGRSGGKNSSGGKNGRKNRGRSAALNPVTVSRGTAAGISILSPSGTSPILTNLTTGEAVYLRRLPDGTDRADFQRRILSPPSPDLALWPVDLLPLSAEQRTLCTLRADHVYVPEEAEHTDGASGADGTDSSSDAGGGSDADSGSGVGGASSADSGSSAGGRSSAGDAWAAVFPLAVQQGLRGGQEALDSLGPLHWKNPAARSMAVRIAEGLDRLHRDGWVCCDLHPSRLFFREDGQVYFDYSNLCAPPGEDVRYYRAGIYPVEFGDPAVVRGIVPRPDERSRNYSLCALAFYLLFGRCPCDGALLSGYPDDDLHNHYVKFRDYHRMPLFLFDPEDSQNAPGVFAEDEELTALWLECPGELRRLFTAALCRKSAERRGGQVPSPGELLDCFRRLGWDRKSKRKNP